MTPPTPQPAKNAPTRPLAAGVLALAALSGGCAAPGRASGRAAFHMEQATLYLERDLPDSALAAFGLALEENFDLADAHLGMGHLFRRSGQLEWAARSYNWALERVPNNFDANYYLGLTRQLMGQFTESLRLYLKAMAIRPGDVRTSGQLAQVYLELGRPRDALPYARRAAQSDDDQAAWVALGAASALVGQYQEAANAYQYALDIGEAQPRIVLGLADALARLERYEQAIEHLHGLARTDPSAIVYERLGYAQFKLRRFDEALASYRAALSLDADDTGALNGLGVCLMTLYIQGGRTQGVLRDEALGAWRRSLLINPQQPRIVDLLNRYHRL